MNLRRTSYSFVSTDSLDILLVVAFFCTFCFVSSSSTNHGGIFVIGIATLTGTNRMLVSSTSASVSVDILLK